MSITFALCQSKAGYLTRLNLCKLTAHLLQYQIRGAEIVLVAQHLGAVEGIWTKRRGSEISTIQKE